METDLQVGVLTATVAFASAMLGVLGGAWVDARRHQRERIDARKDRQLAALYGLQEAVQQAASVDKDSIRDSAAILKFATRVQNKEVREKGIRHALLVTEIANRAQDVDFDRDDGVKRLSASFFDLSVLAAAAILAADAPTPGTLAKWRRKLARRIRKSKAARWIRRKRTEKTETPEEASPTSGETAENSPTTS